MVYNDKGWPVEVWEALGNGVGVSSFSSESVSHSVISNSLWSYGL